MVFTLERSEIILDAVSASGNILLYVSLIMTCDVINFVLFNDGFLSTEQKF